MTQTKTLLENGKVQITDVKEIDRYVGKVVYSSANVDMELDDFKSNNKCWTTKKSREGFDCLDTGENWEPKTENVAEDLTHFQLYLDSTYGKGEYEAFALGAYIHSGVSFSISKGPDTRDRWDSGTIGFIGIPKEAVEYWNKRDRGINEYASFLSDVWNGCLGEIIIWDNYEEDVVDSCWTSDSWEEIQAWKARMKREYDVDEDNYIEENNF